MIGKFHGKTKNRGGPCDSKGRVMEKGYQLPAEDNPMNSHTNSLGWRCTGDSSRRLCREWRI